MIGVFSRRVFRQPIVKVLLGREVRLLHLWHLLRSSKDVTEIAGWGFRKTTQSARVYAAARGLPYLALEDGFLRSFGAGQGCPSLSLVLDRQGIYYAADRPSDLEMLLTSEKDLLNGVEVLCGRAITQILEAGLSKYNLAPDLARNALDRQEGGRVLVVDQTVGDAGVIYGGAGPETFSQMLAAAREENPGATLYVKTHPEVSSGAKRGYLSDVQADSGTVLLRDTVNPLSLILRMDRVYVATSHFGFEALLAGKPVTCFGMPWYAGWGVTDDRQHCARRTRRRSVQELFAAAYLHYTSYLDPKTYQRGEIFDAIDWLRRQRKMASASSGRTIAVGYRRWKAENIRPYLGLDKTRVYFVRNAAAAARLRLTPEDRLVVWGGDPVGAVVALARTSGAKLVRMEDGFLRSVGLGSDFIAPLSLVLDETGIYFDPRQPSDLEHLLNTMRFSAEDRFRASNVRRDIVAHGITKYNIERRQVPMWQPAGRRVVLVPGQVEDDASIRYGCEGVSTNLALLEAVRKDCPDAYIVYKPHPEVLVGNRKGRVHLEAATRFADMVETDCSIVSCVEVCNEVHTMTSLAGFDALLRGKAVTVYGRPFYAGWGLTRDRLSIARRDRALDLDELVAGALLHYPIYWDWTLKGFTTCEAVIEQLVRQREALITRHGRGAANMGAVRRTWRKVKLWAKAGFTLKW